MSVTTDSFFWLRIYSPFVNSIAPPAHLAQTASPGKAQILKRLFLALGALWNSILPSPRLAVYVGFGAALWLVSAFLPGFRLLAIVYDLALLAIALADLKFSPAPADLEIWRSFEPKMNLGVPNNVTLHARSGARQKTTLTVRDEVPDSFTVSTGEPPRFQDNIPLPPLPRAILKLETQDEESGVYKLTPNRRGDFRFGELSARYGTTLGLWFRQFQRTVEDDGARVYPDTTGVRRYELALREGKMRDIGLHLLKLRGRGTEFESLRDYTSDDEFKSINWKASARSGKLIATNYEIERDQTIVICLDCGRMMTSMASSKAETTAPARAATADENWQQQSGDVAALGALATAPLIETPLSKLDCAINATVLLAHVSASMGDNVGLLLFSDTVLNYLPPRKGRIQTGQIIEALYGAQPSLVEPDYQVAYEHLLARRLRRSLIVTFTDIIDPEASRELLNASAALRRHHNALCVTINNRDVTELAGQYPNSAAQLYDKAMAQRMLNQRGSALESLRAFGVGILDVEARELSVATVNRYLNMKSRGVM